MQQETNERFDRVKAIEEVAGTFKELEMLRGKLNIYISHRNSKRLPEPFQDYSATPCGKILSHKTGEPVELKQFKANNGYLTVDLYMGSRSRKTTKTVHTLIALAFLGERPSGQVTRHLDGDSGNNSIMNLKYGTHKENSQDAINHGSFKNVERRYLSKDEKESLMNDAKSMSYKELAEKYSLKISRLYRMKVKQVKDI